MLAQRPYITATLQHCLQGCWATTMPPSVFAIHEELLCASKGYSQGHAVPRGLTESHLLAGHHITRHHVAPAAIKHSKQQVECKDSNDAW